MQDNNKELQKINEELQGLKEGDQSIMYNVKELKETQKQLKQKLGKKTTELRERARRPLTSSAETSARPKE